MNRRVAIGTATVEFSDEGPSALSPETAARDPVVLLHGFTGSKDSWRDLREQLRPNRRVISIDLPGHGGTRVGIDVENYSIERAAAMVIRLLTERSRSPALLDPRLLDGRQARAVYRAQLWRAYQPAGAGKRFSRHRGLRRSGSSEYTPTRSWRRSPSAPESKRSSNDGSRCRCLSRWRGCRPKRSIVCGSSGLAACVEELARSLRGMGTGCAAVARRRITGIAHADAGDRGRAGLEVHRHRQANRRLWPVTRALNRSPARVTHRISNVPANSTASSLIFLTAKVKKKNLIQHFKENRSANRMA